MSTIGLHLSLADAELAALEAVQGGSAKIDHVTNVLEVAKFGTGDAAETDSSWAYIHAALLGIDPDGDVLGERSGPAEANIGDAKYAIMGREVLVSDGDYYLGLTRAPDVGPVASALAAISLEELQVRVKDAHVRFNASGEADEAADYAAGWFPGLVEFYRVSAASARHVIFNVSY